MALKKTTRGKIVDITPKPQKSNYVTDVIAPNNPVKKVIQIITNRDFL